MELVYTAIISSVFGLIGLIYLSYRKDLRSDRNFEKQMIIKEADHKIKMREAKTRFKLKTPAAPKHDIESLIEKYAPAILNRDQENLEDEYPLEDENIATTVIKDLMKNPEIRKVGTEIIKSAVKSKGGETDLTALR